MSVKDWSHSCRFLYPESIAEICDLYYQWPGSSRWQIFSWGPLHEHPDQGYVSPPPAVTPLLPATRESSIPLSSPVSNDDIDLVVHCPSQDRRHRDTHLSRGGNRWTGMLKAEEPILVRQAQKWHVFHAHILNSRCSLWAHCKGPRQKLVL